MASNASDVQVCLWKILKLSSTTCVTLTLKYPFHSLSLLCLFLLYMFFPLVFCVLVYSFPPLVCISIIFSIFFRRRNGYKEETKNEEKCSERRAMFLADYNNNRRSFNRVHSVRQRRAKDIIKEDNHHMQLSNAFEDKNALSSTNIINDILVDKNALKEESPKEIREVEVQHYNRGPAQGSTFPSSASQNPLKNDEFSIKSAFSRLKALEEEEDSKDSKNEDDDHHKNVMDIGISDTYQRNKRLESLIARRRSRKIMSLEVRRTMMKMGKSNITSGRGQIASLIIPKNNAYNSFLPGGAFSGPYSPGPDSAPSVLIPMRNPFDLPYDPQEEKPDLTDHSFQQEFMTSSASNYNNRDIMFCRHESFSLGGSINQNREETSLVRDHFGLRQKDSSKKEFEREFPPTIEQEPYNEVPQSNSTSDNNPHDQIKEIIQVHENGTDHNHANKEESHDHRHVQTGPNVSNSPASNSSSEEDEPIYNKIDKEAILKSLSSMARRNYFQEMEDNINNNNNNNINNINNNDQIDDNLNYAWYADRTMRNCHHPSYSIASDMQVELSEVSSPPLTIDENFCFQDDNYQDISNWDSDPDLWNNAMESRSALDNPAFPTHDTKEHGNASGEIAESSNASNKSRTETNIIESPSTRSAEDRREEMVQSSTNQARNIPQRTSSSNDPQTQTSMANEGLEQNIPVVQSSYLSPKSVLHPTFSLDQLSSYDRDTDEEFQHVSTQTTQVSSPHEHQNSTTEQPTPLPSFNGDVGVLQESSGPSSSSAAEAINKHKIQENLTKPGEVASTSSSHNKDEVSNKTSLLEQKQKSSEPSCVSTSKPVNEQKIQENETKAREDASGSSQMRASPEVPAELVKPTEETNSSSSVNNDKDSSKKSSLTTNEKESSELPSSLSAIEAVNKHKIQENGTKRGEVASSSSQIQATREAPTELLKPLEETSSSSSNNDNKVSNKNSSLSIDQKDSSVPSSVSANKHVNEQKIHENETKAREVASASSQMLAEETNKDKESSKETSLSTNEKESSEPSSVSVSKPVNEQKNHENETKAGEITGPEVPAELVKPTEETNSSSSINNDKDSSEKASLSTNEKESSELTSMSASEAVNKQKIYDNETKQGEVSSGSEAPTKLLKATEETSTSSCNNNDKVSTEKSSMSTNQKQESSEPSNIFTTEAVNKQKNDGNEIKQGKFANGSSAINNDKVSSEMSSLSTDQKQESSVNKQKIHENGTKPGEVDSGSSQVLASQEAHAKPTTETSTVSSKDNVKVSSDQKEPFVPSSTSTTESISKEKIHENGAKLGEVTGNSSQILATHDKPAELLKPIEETSISSFNNNDANSSKKSLQSTDQEEAAKRQEKVATEVIPNDGTKSSKEGDQRENSNLHKDTGHERCSDNPKHHETPISLSVLVEDNDKKNEHDIKD